MAVLKCKNRDVFVWTEKDAKLLRKSGLDKLCIHS